METGFINRFRLNDPSQNLIKVCSGDSAGDFVGFRIEGCCAPLAATLRGGDLDGPSSCPPPDGTPMLKFRLAFQDGEFLAVDVCFV